MWPSFCGFPRDSLHRNALQKCPVNTEPGKGTKFEIEDMSNRSGTTLDTRIITQMTKSTVGASRMEPRIPTNMRLRERELAWALSTTENNLPDYFDEVPIFEPHVLQSILVIAETEKEMT
jgi:hypothetical protein